MGKKWSNEYFLNRVKEQTGDEYKFIEEYVSASTPIKVKHMVCGHTYKVRPNFFLRLGNRCPKCNNKNKMKTHEQFQKEFEKTCDGEYELLSKYSGSHSYIKIKHLKCGNTWEQKATNWISGYRCPKCRASHGEREIRKILKDKGIRFTEQKRFEKCKNKRALPFDFYLLDYNVLIEYQGEQHFRDRETFGGKNSLKQIQKNDKIKLDFCNENNIDLMYITYKQNIEEELYKILNKLIPR